MENIHEFLIGHGVHVVTSGANISSGSVGINCPFCDDPSEHCNISVVHPKIGYWHCFKCKKGSRKLHPLFMQLFHWNYKQANDVIESNTPVAPAGSFQALVNAIKNPVDLTEEAPPVLTMPDEFIPLTKKHYARDHFLLYLRNRGFGRKDIPFIIRHYPLYFANQGPFAWRLILLLHFRQQLVNWTGRTITKTAKIRYKTMKRQEGGLPPSDFVFQYDDLSKIKGKTLVVTEGPLDALKVDFYGRPHVRATCAFTNRVSPVQMTLLWHLAHQFEQIVILFDQATLGPAWEAAKQMHHLPCPVLVGVLQGAKDPGELTPKGVGKLIDHNFHAESIGLTYQSRLHRKEHHDSE